MYWALSKDHFLTVEGVEIFDGFPYLMTYLVRDIYHVTLLPSSWAKIKYFQLAEAQALANRLETFLILSQKEIIRFSTAGHFEYQSTPPTCEIFFANQLKLAWDVPNDIDLLVRRKKLNKVIKQIIRIGGYVFGNISKGGRPATPEEELMFQGIGENSTPRGLRRCPRCGFYRGNCLDPSPLFDGLMMKVHCLCENNNKCARCGEPLYKFRLNSNYYDEKDNNIWYVPGFAGLSHVCPDLKPEKAIN